MICSSYFALTRFYILFQCLYLLLWTSKCQLKSRKSLLEMRRIALFELLNMKHLITVVFWKIPFNKTLCQQQATSQTIFCINQLLDFYMILVVRVSHFGINCNNYTDSLIFKSAFKSNIWKKSNNFWLIEAFYYYYFFWRRVSGISLVIIESCLVLINCFFFKIL